MNWEEFLSQRLGKPWREIAHHRRVQRWWSKDGCTTMVELEHEGSQMEVTLQSGGRLVRVESGDHLSDEEMIGLLKLVGIS